MTLQLMVKEILISQNRCGDGNDEGGSEEWDICRALLREKPGWSEG